MNKKVFWITRTAVLIALLVVVQLVTSSFGNQVLTGSLVNLVLIVGVMTSGLWSGVTIAVLSPIFAKFLGIGPLWQIIPCIMLGNVTIVLVWGLIGNRMKEKKLVSYAVALVAGAVAKFLVLYLSIVRIVIPVFLKLPEPQANKISGMFSVPQLITALIGGVLAAVILPLLEKALKQKG
jgi:riboflavin transporter FmnP